ncbi:MAG: GatB/YqeY domain-containing protein [Actinobacteria bacterium]|nr:GatB/YqeY domain-containing protein [Actinomycetota bacterium]
MTTLLERIDHDIRLALKSGQSQRLQTLRTLRSAIHYVEIENRHAATDDEVRQVLGREARRRDEAAAIYRERGRADRAAAEQAELDLIQSYLPVAVSATEIAAEAAGVIAAVGAKGVGDTGMVMSELMVRLRVKGSVDGKQVSAIVRKLLAHDSA